MNFNADKGKIMLLESILHFAFQNSKVVIFIYFFLTESFLPRLLNEQGQKKSLKDHQYLFPLLFVQRINMRKGSCESVEAYACFSWFVAWTIQILIANITNL